MKQIKITYTNHKGEKRERIILPIGIWFGRSEWHPTDQWFLKAKDVERNVRRDFAMVHISDISYVAEDIPFVDNDIGVPVLPAEEPASQDVHLDKITKAKLFADGGSRGNPGPSASGYAILDMEDNVVKKNGIYLGVTTNNQAEYRALLAGLEDALTIGITELHVYMDSLLVINQVRGIWKIKNADFLPIYDEIHSLLKQFDHVTLTHVPRALNKIADGMVNECLDAQ